MRWNKYVYSFIGGIVFSRYFTGKVSDKINYRIEKNNANVDLLNRWLTLRDRNISIARYLEDNEYKKVAIYGLGMLGNHLYEEVRKTGIEIAGIDQAEIYNNFDMKIYKPLEIFDGVDLIIVTPLEYTTN